MHAALILVVGATVCFASIFIDVFIAQAAVPESKSGAGWPLF